MFSVTEDEATATRNAFDRGGDLSAVAAFRQLFPGIADYGHALRCARAIAGWSPRDPIER